MTLYNSADVLNQDLEVQIQIQNENDKRLNKLLMGVDVIFKPDGKAYISYPFLCPARVHYMLNDEDKMEIFVGIIIDSKMVAILFYKLCTICLEEGLKIYL
jgi:hypothetical protein